MSKFSNVSPDALVILGTLFSILISQNLSSNDINVLGNLVSQIGASLSAKAAQQQNIESNEAIKQQIADMESQLAKLKKQLC